MEFKFIMGLRGKRIYMDLVLIALLSKDWMLNLGDVLPTITISYLCLSAKKNSYYLGVKKCAASMPNATFILPPNLRHLKTFYRRDLIIPHIEKFLAGVS